MEDERSKRKSLRAPVYLDVRCDLPDGTTVKGKAINLGTEGLYLKSPEPMTVGDNVEVEFLLPGTLNSLRLNGEVMWARGVDKEENREDNFHVAGIRFENLEEPYRGMVQDYTLKMLSNEALLQGKGILRLLDDLRNLPPDERLKAYHILIKKGSGPIF
jgi:hypothetical protein